MKSVLCYPIMRKAYYYLLASPIYLFALLPFPLFYLICDVFYVIVYYLIGYRRKVVSTNLRNAFPEKSEQEIKQIAQKYYRFMIDVFLETFKILVISKKQMKKRAHFENLGMIQELTDRHQSFLFVMGHYGNWEWAGQGFQLLHIIQEDALYHPLSSPFFNWLMLKIRTRFGMHLVPMASSIKEMIRRKQELTATAFIADQTPSNIKEAYWTMFLNQDTPVFFGTEKIAKKLNYPVIYATVQRIRRGYYNIRFSKITDDPQNTEDGYITETHTRLLEDDVRSQPETWLWSHRRWKHKRPNSSGTV